MHHLSDVEEVARRISVIPLHNRYICPSQLKSDLSWDDDWPVYVMGAFAQLQLGADALNLAGCRAGSVLVAKALRPVLTD